ncbi:hypothetical protein F3J24_17255 [Comamonas sp. Tr-654]|uniref:hypothetical protein n=1 Tax=Comamonas sp. Tr-654 TaxID=2608341 RepID=UPI001965CC03|nr:hypothetical protein [Comamonas sp. Tr-654]NIF85262.1 hypothetical protein [Comamonas sp. Tr-654]
MNSNSYLILATAYAMVISVTCAGSSFRSGRPNELTRSALTIAFFSLLLFWYHSVAIGQSKENIRSFNETVILFMVALVYCTQFDTCKVNRWHTLVCGGLLFLAGILLKITHDPDAHDPNQLALSQQFLYLSGVATGIGGGMLANFQLSPTKQ